MATPKSIQKLRSADSFGGYCQHRSFRPSQSSPADKGIAPLSSAHGKQQKASGKVRACARAAASKTFSLQDGDFPPLGKPGTDPSMSEASSANPKAMQRPHSKRSLFSLQIEDLPCVPLHARGNPASSGQVRCIAEGHAISRDQGSSSLKMHLSRETNKALQKREQAGYGEHQESRINSLGRVLTSILRHKAPHLNLRIRDDGYVMGRDLLNLEVKTSAGVPLSSHTVGDIQKAVDMDNKQRFSLLTENGVLLVRANQGHSIKTVNSDKLLNPILSLDDVHVCVHGTLARNLSSILKFGLKKMGRNHVHFASGLPKDNGVISGMRHTSEVLVYLDVKKALEDGMKLYRSDNGVILTEGFNGVVPPLYFARVVKMKDGSLVSAGTSGGSYTN